MGTRTRDNAGYEDFFNYVAECGLLHEMRTICLQHRVTLRDIYLDTRGPTIHAARLEVWWWLTTCIGKSTNEVGIIFNRDGTSIMYAQRKLKERAVAFGKTIDKDTVHEVSSLVASETHKGWSEARLRAARKKL